MLRLFLTYWIDIKEADRCTEYTIEHAIMKRLCAFHQDVEQQQTPYETKDQGGYSQTWRKKHTELYM